jgi:L-threonylcarbamoyladenylate synthase
MTSDVEIARAAAVLERGGLVAFPTETVYGLGADASNVDALRRLYAVKGRPEEHPVIVHVADADALDAWAAHVPDEAHELARALWPGPLTLVLRRAAHVPDEVTGGLDTVGLRVPDQPVALALLRAFAGDPARGPRGVAAPSANRFGRVSPTTADAVRADLGADVDVVLDGGPCEVGVESTILDLSSVDRDGEATILRVGRVTPAHVEQLLGRSVAVHTTGGGAHRAPGTLASHYAPRARVELTTRDDLAPRVRAALARGESVGVLALRDDVNDECRAVTGAPGQAAAVHEPDAPTNQAVLLASPGDADEYAHALYAALRSADARSLDVIVAVAPDDVGIGAAVGDRLRRASAPRP